MSSKAQFRRNMVAFLAGSIAALSASTVLAANIFVIGGKPTDPFWSVVKRGAEAAGKVVKAEGGSVTWLGPQSYAHLGQSAANLIRQAISQHADAIVAPDWVPQAEDPALKAVVKAHIPLIIYNAGGIKAANRLGAMNYIGSDDYKAGVAAGKYFAKHGLKDLICINTLPGAANIEAECKGMHDGVTAEGGKGTTLPLPATSFGSATAVAQAVKAYLLRHPRVDGIYTIGQADATSSISAVMQAGKMGRVKVGGLNIDQTVLDNIRSGKQMFAIDQQPYMQGFLAVSILNTRVNYGLTVPTREILTGPKIVDKSNVKLAIQGVKEGVR